ncbi:hypothetical protein ACFIN9_01040 [Streptomyces noursei]|uniref:hypothetical protein n=1 Tax=Streptomyces noursei TaxID=1971 RepID=UPI0036D28870
MPARSSNNHLVVPVEVAALAVNARMQNPDGAFVWHRWIANFFHTQDTAAPAEPSPFSIDADWPTRPENRGVYLQWQLPEALTRGRHDTETDEDDFPLVPNRWLVVRYRAASRNVRAWLIESDHLGLDSGTVSALDPRAERTTATKMGRCHELTTSSPWREPGDAPTPFLTALGPGLLTFSAFQPYNTNVFSLHDGLDDVAGDERLDYYVAGFYSTPDSDVLDDAEDLRELLDDLEWLAPMAGSNTRRSLYTGSALGVDWQPAGPLPASDIPAVNSIAVSVGNNTAEAATALTDAAAGPGALSDDDSRLVRAFALGTLDALDRADGDDLTDAAAHQSGFGPVPGGFTWRIVERGEDRETGPVRLGARERARTRTAEADIVAALNRAQAEHDGVERDLAAAQDRLYVLWALSNADRQPRDFQNRVDDELDPANQAGAAGKVAALAADLCAKRNALPWGDTPEELEASAAEYARGKGLPPNRVLQRVPKSPFLHVADPVVLLQGGHVHAPLSRDTPLPCRTEDRLVTAVGPIDAAAVRSDVDQVNTANLPAPFTDLLTEFFILARARHTGTGLDDVTGTLPEYGTAAWRQPWQPLFLVWDIECWPLPYSEHDGTRHWTFDGNRYRWQGTGTVPESFVLTGRIPLTPSAGPILEGELDAYAAGRQDLPDLRNLRTQLSDLDMLSQRLEGLTAHLDQRDPRSTARPLEAMGDLIGHGDRHFPVPGTVPSHPSRPPESEPFHEVRTGQFAFRQLSLVDRFGRTLNLIGDNRRWPYVRPDAMVPDHTVETDDPDRFLELSPRLFQPARLAFDFLHATTDQPIDLTPGANPVCAWLLHNRLDRTLACYDPDGQALGELRTVLKPDGTKSVVWLPLPGSSVATLAELEDVAPHAHHFLHALAERGPATFDALRATLDDALTTIDPDGPDDASLGFLLGRPLALLRAHLDLELCGPPRTSVGWNEVLDPDDHAPAMPDWKWIVRLGQPRATDDGLVGYVLNDDYAHFDTITPPADGSSGYLRPIDNGERLQLAFAGTSTATVTLLADPRAAVHATTDVLPASAVHVPPAFTDTALARMAVCFRTGPLMAGTTADPRTAVLPHPATASGTWAWAEPTDTQGTWQHLPITAPDPGELPLGDPELRSGYLVLNDAAEATR